jgi:single-strand DNA-binding protein
MASLNQVTLLGNVGNDPELRYTAQQTPVTTFSLATSEKYDGKEVTEWHKIVVWGKNAENCAKYVEKGKPVLVQGKIKTRSYDDQKTGIKKYVTEIVAIGVTFLGTKSQPSQEKSLPRTEARSQPTPSYDNFDDLPF